MGRKPAPQPLALSSATTATPADGTDTHHQSIRQLHSPFSTDTASSSSPTSSSRSPRSPLYPFRFGPKKSHRDRERQDLQTAGDVRKQSRQTRKSSPASSPVKSFAPTRSQSQGQILTQSPRQRHDPARDPEATSPYLPLAATLHQASSLRSPMGPRGKTMPGGPESPPLAATTPELIDGPYADHSVQKPNPSLPTKSDLSLSSVDHEAASARQTGPKKPKTKPFGLLGRTKSQRDRDRNRSASRERERDSAAASPVKTADSTTHLDRSFSQTSSGLRTAPLHSQDRSLRDMMSSAVRNRSEDRADLRDNSNSKEHHKQIEQARALPSSFRDNGGTFLSGLRSSSTKAAGLIRDGLFGKHPKPAPSPDKELVVDDEHYVLKVINLPLVEQVRKTRISKRLEDSRDKTEFWMPAFPWRAIDYLNYKGCDVEGLYRVPGSGPQIKKWQRKFDEEHDVDLFAQDDLYDINIIGSMLKAWLRELPDEIFPKEAQDRVSRECAGAETVPQMLIDELSNLPPFNYYLLFAITCHLSLLLAHSDKNKMDFRNLCICFQPCMKIDVFCFKFLVCDWRDCWKGCNTEPKYIEEEYALLDQPAPRVITDARKPIPEEVPVVEEPAVSSSDGSSPPPTKDAHKLRPKKKNLQLLDPNGQDSSSSSANLTINSERAGNGNDLRPLSPIKPLSPLNF